jgi:hypothetical protein
MGRQFYECYSTYFKNVAGRFHPATQQQLSAKNLEDIVKREIIVKESSMRSNYRTKKPGYWLPLQELKFQNHFLTDIIYFLSRLIHFIFPNTFTAASHYDIKLAAI